MGLRPYGPKGPGGDGVEQPIKTALRLAQERGIPVSQALRTTLGTLLDTSEGRLEEFQENVNTVLKMFAHPHEADPFFTQGAGTLTDLIWALWRWYERDPQITQTYPGMKPHNQDTLERELISPHPDRNEPDFHIVLNVLREASTVGSQNLKPSDHCVLCAANGPDQEAGEYAIRWRRYYIKPNIKPMEKGHFTLIDVEHTNQYLSQEIAEEMIQLAQWLPGFMIFKNEPGSIPAHNHLQAYPADLSWLNKPKLTIATGPEMSFDKLANWPTRIWIFSGQNPGALSAVSIQAFRELAQKRIGRFRAGSDIFVRNILTTQDPADPKKTLVYVIPRSKQDADSFPKDVAWYRNQIARGTEGDPAAFKQFLIRPALPEVTGRFVTSDESTYHRITYADARRIIRSVSPRVREIAPIERKLARTVRGDGVGQESRDSEGVGDGMMLVPDPDTVEHFLRKRLELFLQEGPDIKLGFWPSEFRSQGSRVLAQDELELLYELARTHHQDRTREDDGRTPYLTHILGTHAHLRELGVESRVVNIEAIFHDSLPGGPNEALILEERKEEIRHQLQRIHLTSEERETVIAAIDRLTRREGEDYGEYLARIATTDRNDAAVKIADLMDILSHLKHDTRPQRAYEFLFGGEHHTGIIHVLFEVAMPNGKPFLEHLPSAMQNKFKIVLVQALLDNYLSPGDRLSKQQTEFFQNAIHRIDPSLNYSTRYSVDESLRRVLKQLNGPLGDGVGEPSEASAKEGVGDEVVETVGQVASKLVTRFIKKRPIRPTIKYIGTENNKVKSAHTPQFKKIVEVLLALQEKTHKQHFGRFAPYEHIDRFRFDASIFPTNIFGATFERGLALTVSLSDDAKNASEELRIIADMLPRAGYPNGAIGWIRVFAATDSKDEVVLVVQEVQPTMTLYWRFLSDKQRRRIKRWHKEAVLYLERIKEEVGAKAILKVTSESVKQMPLLYTALQRNPNFSSVLDELYGKPSSRHVRQTKELTLWTYPYGVKAEYWVLGDGVGQESRDSGLLSEALSKEGVGDGIAAESHMSNDPTRLARYTHMTEQKLEAFITKYRKTPLDDDDRALMRTLLQRMTAIREELAPAAALNKMLGNPNLCCKAVSRLNPVLDDLEIPHQSLVKYQAYGKESSLFTYHDFLYRLWNDFDKDDPPMHAYLVVNLLGVPFIVDLVADQFVYDLQEKGFQDTGIVMIPVKELQDKDWPYAMGQMTFPYREIPRLSRIVNGDRASLNRITVPTAADMLDEQLRDDHAETPGDGVGQSRDSGLLSEASAKEGDGLKRSRASAPTENDIRRHYSQFDRHGIKQTKRGPLILSRASSYQRLRLWFVKQLSDLAQKLGKAELNILSIGSGRGELESALKRRGHHVTGMDLSEVNARFAQMKGVETVVWNAEKRHKFDTRFDVIIFSESIGHMDLGRAFSNANNYLRNGGMLIITTYEKTVDRSNLDKHTLYRTHTDTEIINALRQSGFSLIDSNKIEFTSIMDPIRYFIAQRSSGIAKGRNKHPKHKRRNRANKTGDGVEPESRDSWTVARGSEGVGDGMELPRTTELVVTDVQTDKHGDIYTFKNVGPDRITENLYFLPDAVRRIPTWTGLIGLTALDDRTFQVPSASGINSRLSNLLANLKTPARFYDAKGRISKRRFLRQFAEKGELPMSIKGSEFFHDRDGHLLAYSTWSDELISTLRTHINFVLNIASLVPKNAEKEVEQLTTVIDYAAFTTLEANSFVLTQNISDQHYRGTFIATENTFYNARAIGKLALALYRNLMDKGKRDPALSSKLKALEDEAERVENLIANHSNEVIEKMATAMMVGIARRLAYDRDTFEWKETSLDGYPVQLTRPHESSSGDGVVTSLQFELAKQGPIRDFATYILKRSERKPQLQPMTFDEAKGDGLALIAIGSETADFMKEFTDTNEIEVERRVAVLGDGNTVLQSNLMSQGWNVLPERYAVEGDGLVSLKRLIKALGRSVEGFQVLVISDDRYKPDRDPRSVSLSTIKKLLQGAVEVMRNASEVNREVLEAATRYLLRAA